MGKTYFRNIRPTYFLRGGGCTSSRERQEEQSINSTTNSNLFDLFTKFNHYVQVIENKANVAANQQESQEIMIAIQWFILQEENIYQLNKYAHSVKESYDSILDAINRLLKSCLIYVRTDQFKCLYILQITTSLSKVIFSFHLINDQRYMKRETQNCFLDICGELRHQIEIEKNELIQNQIELFLFLTQTALEIAPSNCMEKEEILKGCLRGIIGSFISLSTSVGLLDSLLNGAFMLYKKYDVSKKRKQYEVYYQIDMLLWEVISYFKDDKDKSLEEIILLIEQMYETTVKNSKNWNDHYLWIQMIGKILIYNPLVTKQMLAQQLKNSINIEAKSIIQTWKDYKNKGLLIQTNHGTDQAIIVINQLQNKKILQFDRLILENCFKGWENLIFLKEFLINESQQSSPYSFGSYLKYKFLLENRELDKNLLVVSKLQNLLSFIISNKLIKLTQQTYEKLGLILKIWKKILTPEKQINIQILWRSYSQQIEKIIYNLEEYYFQNAFYILKNIMLNLQKNVCPSLQFANNEFIQLQKLKYSIWLLEQLLQQSIEIVNDRIIVKRNQFENEEIENNQMIQKQKELLQNLLKSFHTKEKEFTFITDIQQKLIEIPSLSENNFSKEAQSMIKIIESSRKQIQKLEILVLQNNNVVKIFEELLNNLYFQYDTIYKEIYNDFKDAFVILQETITLQFKVEAGCQNEEHEKIKKQIFSLSNMKFIQNSRFNLLKFNLKLLSFKDSFQILIRSANSEDLQKVQEVVNFDEFFLNAIKYYPQRITNYNFNDENEMLLEKQISEVTEEQLNHKLSKQKGTIQFMLFKLKLEQQIIEQEIFDLELIEKEFGESFEAELSYSKVKKIDKLLDSLQIGQSLQNVIDVKFNESQLKIEKEKFDNFLQELRKIKDTQQMVQLQQLINQTEIVVESFQNSVNQSVKIFQILLSEELRDLNNKIEECKRYGKQFELQHIRQRSQDSRMGNLIDWDEKLTKNCRIEKASRLKSQKSSLNSEQFSKILQNKDQMNDCQNLDDSQICYHNSFDEQYQINLQLLIKLIKFQNKRIANKKEILEKLFVEVKQFADISDFIKKKPADIKREVLKRFNSIIQSTIKEFEQLQWVNFNLQQIENESFEKYVERILNELSEETQNQQVEEISDQQVTNIQDFLNKLKVSLQKSIRAKYQFNELQIDQEFIILQLKKIYPQENENEKISDDSYEELNLIDNQIVKQIDTQNNCEWKIKQGLVFTIIQISSNCFSTTITQFCQKALIQLWAQEKDQQVRNLLKNKDLLNMQMQILQKDWKTQHGLIEGEMQSMLKKIDDLQEQISHEENLNMRDQQLKELDQATQQLEEYIENISEMGQSLRLITDFINHLRKGLARVEGKINEMKDQLSSMDNDIKFLRGKSVKQLLEIRKWKVLKDAAQKNIKSIYIPLKTLEKGKEEFSKLMNLQQFDDKEGEVNEFLIDDEQQVLLIHGIAGSGKSTTAKKIEEFIWKLHEKNQFKQVLIPIYISLPTLKNPVFQAVEEALNQDEYGFGELQMKECKEMLGNKEFRLLLIMDSYDEMKLENLQKNLYLSNNLYKNWSNPLVIFTTRSEIFSSANYADWFAPDDKKKLKEIQLLKFDKEQKREYLQKFTFLSIKVLIFETYELLNQIENRGPIDIKQFETVWDQFESQVLCQYLSKQVKSELLLNSKQIETILFFLKNDKLVALNNVEAIRSLDINLQKLWSVEKYENIMRIVNLEKLIETPYMMEIIVQVLPLMVAKTQQIENLKQNFIKNFSKMFQETLKSVVVIQKHKQQLLSDQNDEREKKNTLIDIKNLEKIDIPLAALQVWHKMEQMQILIRFELQQTPKELRKKLLNIFEQLNIQNLIFQGITFNKPVINEESLIELICDSLTKYNLTSFDFYEEFIRQYHLKQIDKLRTLGKRVNVDRFLHDLNQYSTKLAKVLGNKQLTQAQYKQQGLLYQDLNEEKEWLNEFFNYDGQNGAYKKDIRSCSLVQQKGSNYQFVHKSIQEFYIAADLYQVLVLSKDFDFQIFSLAIKLLAKKEFHQDYSEFLSSDQMKNQLEMLMHFENLSLFEKQKQLKSLEDNMKKLSHFIKVVKDHDFNSVNYSTKIYAETRNFLIKKILNEIQIIECLKFFVQLTSVEFCFIQCGSNSLNLLAQMKADLSKQDFQNIKIKNTSLSGANFVKSNLSGSVFENVNVKGINLNGALLINCNWKNLIINELYQLNGHNAQVLSVCFSPDGKILASGSWDQQIILWDAKTGEQNQQLNGHSNSIQSICFSPIGNILASGDKDNLIYLWNVKTGDQKFQLKGHSEAITSLSFSPDGLTLASSSQDKSICLWDTKSGDLKLQLIGQNESVVSISFSPDGSTLASASDQIQLWNVRTGKLKLKLQSQPAFYQVTFSPDGVTLACSQDHIIIFWDVKTGEQKSHQQCQHDNTITSICYSPDGAILASGSEDKSICLWDSQTGEIKSQLIGHSQSISSISFSPDGKTLASGSFDFSIRLWDVKTGEEKSWLNKPARFVRSECFTPDGTSIVSASESGKIVLWDTKTGEEISQFNGNKGCVLSLCLSHDGVMLAYAGQEGSIHLLDLKKGQQQKQLKEHNDGVFELCFSPDDLTLASCSIDKSICFWEVKTGKLKFKFDDFNTKIKSICFSPDGLALASASAPTTEVDQKSLCLWNLKTRKQILQIKGHNYDIHQVRLSPDSNILASCGQNKSIHLWDVKTGEIKFQLYKHSGIVNSICFSTNCATLASGSEDKSICLWNVESGTLKLQLISHNDSVYSVCFSSDNSILASGSKDKSILLWDVETGEQKLQLFGHRNAVIQVCFSPDDALLASISEDQSICLWDVKTGKEQSQLNELFGSAQTVCFSPDGTIIAFGGIDKYINLWNVHTGELKQKLNGDNDAVKSICFSPDGTKLISGSEDKTICLWDVTEGILISSQNKHDYTVYSVSISPNGHSLAFGVLDGSIHFWNMTTGEEIYIYNGHSFEISSVCFSPSGTTLATGSSDCSICLWDVKTGKRSLQLKGHGHQICQVCYSPDGTIIASASWDKSICLWDAITGKLKSQLFAHRECVKSICFSPDGNVLSSGSTDKSIRLWDLETGGKFSQLNTHRSIIYSVCLSQKRTILACSNMNESIQIYDVETGKQKFEFNGHIGLILSMQISQDDQILASGGQDSLIRLWDLNSGQQKSQLIGHNGAVQSVIFSPDGITLASSSNDKSIRFWDMETGEEKQQLNGNNEIAISLYFSKDGETLASIIDSNTTRYWDVKSGGQILPQDDAYFNAHPKFSNHHNDLDIPNIIPTLCICQDQQLQAIGTVIFQGQFINHLGMDLRRLFYQKGSIFLDSQFK